MCKGIDKEAEKLLPFTIEVQDDGGELPFKKRYNIKCQCPNNN